MVKIPTIRVGSANWAGRFRISSVSRLVNFVNGNVTSVGHVMGMIPIDVTVGLN